MNLMKTHHRATSKGTHNFVIVSKCMKERLDDKDTED